nr:hypothetical protein [Flavobacterium sp. ASV13]
MKKIITIGALGAIIFAALTFLTANLGSRYDGNDEYGFPVTFFICYGGMEPPPPSAEITTIFYFNLAFDIVICIILAISIFMGCKIFLGKR